MKKNAYQYLFGQDTLYQVVEPEPLAPRPSPTTAPAVQAEISVVETVAEQKPEPVQREIIVVETSVKPTPEPVSSEPQKPVLPPKPEVVAKPVIEPVTPPAPVPVLETIPGAKPAVAKPKVLLLIDEELTPGELIFLENILKAIHLNLNEIDILNLAGSGLVDFHAVLENKTLHHFISFGIPFKTIHLDIQMDRYQPIRIFGITFLLADPLSALEADQKLKRKLWAVLKKVFLD